MTRTNGEASVGAALADVVNEGQRVVVDRIDLALLEGKVMLSEAAKAFGLVLAGVLLVAGGWIALNWGLAHVLATYTTGWIALFSVAALHLVLGLVVLLLGRRHGKQVRRPSQATQGSEEGGVEWTRARRKG